MDCSVFTEFYNYNCSIILEHFITLERNPVLIIGHPPYSTPTPRQTLVNFLSILNISYKMNQTRKCLFECFFHTVYVSRFIWLQYGFVPHSFSLVPYTLLSTYIMFSLLFSWTFRLFPLLGHMNNNDPNTGIQYLVSNKIILEIVLIESV